MEQMQNFYALIGICTPVATVLFSLATSRCSKWKRFVAVLIYSWYLAGWTEYVAYLESIKHGSKDIILFWLLISGTSIVSPFLYLYINRYELMPKKIGSFSLHDD